MLCCLDLGRHPDHAPGWGKLDGISDQVLKHTLDQSRIMSPETIARHGTANLIYTTPLILYGMFRYLYLLYIHKAGEDPAGEVLKDRHVLVAVLAWLAVTIAILA